jgi:hypothetical protein
MRILDYIAQTLTADQYASAYLRSSDWLSDSRPNPGCQPRQPMRAQMEITHLRAISHPGLRIRLKRHPAMHGVPSELRIRTARRAPGHSQADMTPPL